MGWTRWDGLGNVLLRSMLLTFAARIFFMESSIRTHALAGAPTADNTCTTAAAAAAGVVANTMPQPALAIRQHRCHQAVIGNNNAIREQRQSLGYARSPQAHPSPDCSPPAHPISSHVLRPTSSNYIYPHPHTSPHPIPIPLHVAIPNLASAPTPSPSPYKPLFPSPHLVEGGRLWLAVWHNIIHRENALVWKQMA